MFVCKRLFELEYAPGNSIMAFENWLHGVGKCVLCVFGSHETCYGNWKSIAQVQT